MKRILIVEDEIALREVYVMLFQMEKFTVFEAVHGKEAMSKLPASKPDVIVLDMLMPVMGGLDFLKSANLQKKYPKSKVLVLSNLSDPKTLEQIEKFGAHKYLLKSDTSPTDLVKAVNALLSSMPDK